MITPLYDYIIVKYKKWMWISVMQAEENNKLPSMDLSKHSKDKEEYKWYV